MIARLCGKVVERDEHRLVLDVHGVGYEVFAPRAALLTLPEGAEVTLHIHTQVREDAIHLYGFESRTDKAMFLLLVGVTGIGPKLALALLSAMPAAELAGAIARADITALSRVSGVGKKTAGRLALELKDKVLTVGVVPATVRAAVVAASAPDGVGDAISALVNLGYPRNHAETAIRQAAETHPELPVEGLIRLGLAALAKG
ncbi:MAG: Holliday junction branch migration protein RuvA [Nitrospirota bacterium]|nr:Holliday junction branch migration protein RuvA [Nitrospirota bacterium]